MPPDERGRPAKGGPEVSTATRTETSLQELDDRRMTKAERLDLAKLARLNERVARSAVDERAAELKAQAEALLSTTFRVDDDAWAEATAAAEAAVRQADDTVAERCRQLGIPVEFRPTLRLGWYGRGENAFAERRAELRATVRARIDASAKSAKHRIAAASAEVQTNLLADGLTTEAAQAFLSSMPTPEQLMPALDEVELKALGVSR